MRFKVTTIIALACAGGFVASAVLNMIQFQHAQENTRLLQGRISDLQYQYNLDHASPTPVPDASTPAPSAAPEATPTPPAPADTPAVAGSAAVSIPDPVDAKLAVADPVADLTYFWTTSGGLRVASLTTGSLKAKYPNCGGGSANNALGILVRKKDPSTSTGHAVKTIGGYTYYYLDPSGYCATDAAGKAALDAGRAAVKNTVLATLTQ
ncbi:MAG TPA: hypothetical protein VI322_01040 [Candidatus Saccharimonadia bacterium]